jgi:regulatory protein
MKVRRKDGTWKEIIYDEKQLYRYGLNRLSERDFGKQELMDKMARLQPDKDMIGRVAEKLIEMGYLSDERRAEAMIRMGEGREGLQKIVSRLKDKGIDPEVIAKKIEEFKEKQSSGDTETELEKAHRLLSRKFEVVEREQHQKALRFLVTKGFSFDVAQKAIKNLGLTTDAFEESSSSFKPKV